VTHFWILAKEKKKTPRLVCCRLAVSSDKPNNKADSFLGPPRNFTNCLVAQNDLWAVADWPGRKPHVIFCFYLLKFVKVVKVDDNTVNIWKEIVERERESTDQELEG
jgi:hypothetical protein